MGIIIHLTAALLYLVSIAIDVLGFFLLIRAVKNRWNPGWVNAFDRAGKTLIDGWFNWLGKIFKSRFKKTLSTRELFICSCVLMFIAKLIVSLFIGTFAN